MNNYPDFLLDATPGAREALAALDAADAARKGLTLTYPAKTRPLAAISRRAPGTDVLEPLPTVDRAEFERARLAYERFRVEVNAADKALDAARAEVVGLVYGSALDDQARTARQTAAAERVAAIDEALATVPMLANEVADLEAERNVATRYALVTDPQALEGADRGLTTTIKYPDGNVLTVTPHGVERPERGWTRR